LGQVGKQRRIAQIKIEPAIVDFTDAQNDMMKKLSLLIDHVFQIQLKFLVGHDFPELFSHI
jgi:hypothetical protein